MSKSKKKQIDVFSDKGQRAVSNRVSRLLRPGIESFFGKYLDDDIRKAIEAESEVIKRI